MTRKDSEKETDRPHYYSQFWLDVAAGRRVIGTPIGAQTESKLDEGTDLIEVEPEELEPITLSRTGSNNAMSETDGYREPQARPQAVIEPAPIEEEELIEPDLEEFDLANDVDDLDIPNIVVDDTEDEPDLAEMDLIPSEDPEEEEFMDMEEEEEEDEDEWSAGRGRKKPKPGRQVKQPKKPKRERRSF